MYRSLDIIQENKDMLIGRINRALNEEYGEDRFSMLFYDVTNTYFETSMTDEEKGLVQDDFLENLVARIEEAISLKILPAEALTTDGIPNYEVLPQASWMRFVMKRFSILATRPVKGTSFLTFQ